MSLLPKIESRDACISVVGLGYVGLPLAVAFAEAGFRVVGLEKDQQKIDSVNRGMSYIADVPSSSLQRLVAGVSVSANEPKPVHPLDCGRRGHFSATSDFSTLDSADVVILCVPTPLNKSREPDVSYIIAAVEEIGRYLHPDMLVVLESTSYPGTTEELVLPMLRTAYDEVNSKRNGSGGSAPDLFGAVGKELLVAFSPERIDPGRRDWTLKNTPKVIGGVTPQCLQVATKLYATIVDSVVPVSSTKTAEMVKLLENTFRAVNIGLVNEMAIICDRLGIDVWEVVEAARTKPFGFMPFSPGPGLGGHCLPVDPQYLAWKMKELNYTTRFIQLADEINYAMPFYVIGKITDALNKQGKPLKGSKVIILGVSYKPDVADIRESPAIDLLQLLLDRDAVVSYHDPLIEKFDVAGREFASTALTEDTLSAAECVVIVSDHKTYDWSWVARHSKLIIDTRNATGKASLEGKKIIKI